MFQSIVFNYYADNYFNEYINNNSNTEENITLSGLIVDNLGSVLMDLDGSKLATEN